jgi:F-type H+-transporting ATPase subunit beta
MSFHLRGKPPCSARVIQRFLSHVQRGTRLLGASKQVPVAETVRGFKEILDGKHDSVAEGDFYMKGGIEEVKPS